MKRFVVCALLLLVKTASAQDWVKVTPLSDSISITPYFINTDTGFAYSSSLIFTTGNFAITLGYHVPPAPGVFRTTDGGNTWKSVRGLEDVHVSGFSFVSRNSGYACSVGTKAGSIYVTHDCGQSWNKIEGPDGQFTSVYAVGKNIFASTLAGDTRYGCGPLWHTNDNGVTWDTSMSVAGLPFAHPQFEYIYGNRDSLVATVTGRVEPSNPVDVHYWMVYSTDLGASWSSVDCGTLQGMLLSLFIAPHQCSIIRELHYGCASGWYGLQRANYPYSDWKFALELYPEYHSHISAWVYGNSCAMYTPYTDDNQLARMYRSDPDFLSGGWVMVSNKTTGPGFSYLDEHDYHNVSVVGHGSVVYASDGRDIWKSTKGGVGPNDYQPTLSSLDPQIRCGNTVMGSYLQLSTCQAETFAAAYQSLRCQYTALDSIWIDGLGSDEYSYTSHHQNPCVSAAPDTTWFSLSAKKPGRRAVQIHARFVDDEFETMDTTMQLLLDVAPSAGSIPIALYLKTASMSVDAGQTVSIPVYASANATIAGITTITLPFALDANTLNVVAFDPAIAGITVGSLNYSNGVETLQVSANDLTMSGETLLGSLRCVAYLSDTLATSVVLQTPQISAESSNCIGLSTQSNEVAIAFSGCGDQTVLNFMKSGVIPTLVRVSPDPACDFLHLELQDVWDHPASIQLMDALGNLRLSNMTASNHEEMNISALPTGVYYLKVNQTVKAVIISR